MELIFSLTTDRLNCDWCLNKTEEDNKIESPFDDKVTRIKGFLAYFKFRIPGVLFLSMSYSGF